MLKDFLLWKVAGKGGGASSWNELEGRPFYTEGGPVDVLPATPFTYSEEDVSFFHNAPIDISAGVEYTITVNGTEYICVTQSVIENDMEYAVLGNLSIMGMGDDTGEPFVLAAFPTEFVPQTGIGAMLVMTDGSTEAVVAITGYVETIQKLDNKYLDLEWLPAPKRVRKTLYSNDSLEIVTAGWHVLSEANLFDLIEGETYDITFEGVKYQNICQKLEGILVDEIKSVTYCIGNLSLYNAAYEDTGEPFCYWYVTLPEKLAGVYECYFHTKDYRDTTVSVSVIGYVTIINPMPEKFRDYIFNLTVDENKNAGCDKNFEEIVSAYNQGLSLAAHIKIAVPELGTDVFMHTKTASITFAEFQGTFTSMFVHVTADMGTGMGLGAIQLVTFSFVINRDNSINWTTDMVLPTA